jgi:hypothetical protein
VTATYVPRLQPLIPVGHECWLAVSRVKTPRIGQGAENATVDENIEWLLHAITAPGADQAQRQDDLVTLAEIVLKARGEKVVVRTNTVTGEPTQWTYQGGAKDWGYGRAPIDADCHGHECIVCRHAGCDQEPIFDGHPYTEMGFCDSRTVGPLIHDGMHQFNDCIGWRPPTDDEIKEHFA